MADPTRGSVPTCRCRQEIVRTRPHVSRQILETTNVTIGDQIGHLQLLQLAQSTKLDRYLATPRFFVSAQPTLISA